MGATMTQLKDAALEYLDWGLSVFPCRGKKPLIEWGEYSKRQPTEEEIEKWWEDWPDANIALATGAVSGVAVIDLDNEAAIQWAKDNLADARPMAWQTTGKGKHLLYQTNGTPIPNAVGIVEGVDIRGDGGYIMLAPSIHPKTQQPYRLSFAPGATWSDLTYFPADKIPARASEDREPVTLEPVEEGTRNETLARIAGRYFFRGLELAEVMALCKGWNADLDDPLPRQEVEATVKSIHKKHRENHPFEEGAEASGSKWKQVEASGTPVEANGSGVEAFGSAVEADGQQSGSQRPANTLRQAVQNWITANPGIFTTSQIDSEFNLKTRQEKNNRAKVLNRLQGEGVIRREGRRSGVWRTVDGSCEAMDLFGTEATRLVFPMPLGVCDHALLYPGSILVVAGTSNAGKSAFVTNSLHMLFASGSTLRNTYNIYRDASGSVQENSLTYAQYLAPHLDPTRDEAEVHYFNSEMAAPELRDRLQAYPGGVEAFRKVNFWKRTSDFADVIRPNAVNIIDFMEIYDDFWKIGQWINEIHRELDRGIAVIVIQKKSGADVGRGGEVTMEKPRLYVTLESNAPYGGICKIVKSKCFANSADNPNGKEIDFRLAEGWKFRPTSQWRHVDEKDRERINREYKKQTAGEDAYAYEFATVEGEVKGVNIKDVEKWIEAYPDVDVDGFLKNAQKRSKKNPWLKSKSWIFQITGQLGKMQKQATATGAEDEKQPTQHKTGTAADDIPF